MVGVFPHGAACHPVFEGAADLEKSVHAQVAQGLQGRVACAVEEPLQCVARVANHGKVGLACALVLAQQAGIAHTAPVGGARRAPARVRPRRPGPGSGPGPPGDAHCGPHRRPAPRHPGPSCRSSGAPALCRAHTLRSLVSVSAPVRRGWQFPAPGRSHLHPCFSIRGPVQD